MAGTPKRPRRQFTDEFKASAVRLVLNEGKTVGAAARDLDRSFSRCSLSSSATLNEINRTLAGRASLPTSENMSPPITHEINHVRSEVRDLKDLVADKEMRPASPSEVRAFTATFAAIKRIRTALDRELFAGS